MFMLQPSAFELVIPCSKSDTFADEASLFLGDMRAGAVSAIWGMCCRFPVEKRGTRGPDRSPLGSAPFEVRVCHRTKVD